MRRILAIFRKDARHLWPQGAVLAALLTLAAALDPTYRGGASVYYEWLPSFALPLAMWLIVISAIHQDKLVGDRQYWLTRPYSRKELAAAKIIFVAVFLNLPLLVYHVTVYAAIGIPPAQHLADLFWRQVFFTAFYLLPVLALAAVTRSLSRALVVALLTAVAFTAVGILYPMLSGRPFLARAAGSPFSVLQAVLLAAGVSAVVALQYARRMTAIAGTVAAVTAVAVLLSASWQPSHAHTTYVGSDVIRLALDSDPTRHSATSPAEDPDLIHFDLPVLLDHVPGGVALDVLYLNLSLEVPGRRATERHPQAEFHGLAGDRAWLSFSTGKHLLEQTGGQPVVVYGSFELQLFTLQSSLPTPRGSSVVVPGIGACHDAQDAWGGISFVCYSPAPHAALLAGQPGSRANWIVSPGSIEGVAPDALDLQPVRRFSTLVPYRDWQQAAGLKLIAARPVPPVQVTFRMSPVPLQQYLVADR